MEIVSGNIFIRKPADGALLPAGYVIEMHEHNFDHTTICFAGAFRISALGRAAVIKSPREGWGGPSHLLIEAGVRHEITALEDGSCLWCVYSHRSPDGAVCERYSGWEDAYSTHLSGAP